MIEKSLCPTCVHSIWCRTWAEWKCRILCKRIRNPDSVTGCEHYKTRPKGFKEPKCQCEDCLKNELLYEEDCDE